MHWGASFDQSHTRTKMTSSNTSPSLVFVDDDTEAFTKTVSYGDILKSNDDEAPRLDDQGLILVNEDALMIQMHPADIGESLFEGIHISCIRNARLQLNRVSQLTSSQFRVQSSGRGEATSRLMHDMIVVNLFEYNDQQFSILFGDVPVQSRRASTFEARQLTTSEQVALSIAIADAAGLGFKGVLDTFFSHRRYASVSLSTLRPVKEFGRRLVESIRNSEELSRINASPALVIHGFNNKTTIASGEWRDPNSVEYQRALRQATAQYVGTHISYLIEDWSRVMKVSLAIGVDLKLSPRLHEDTESDTSSEDDGERKLTIYSTREFCNVLKTNNRHIVVSNRRGLIEALQVGDGNNQAVLDEYDVDVEVLADSIIRGFRESCTHSNGGYSHVTVGPRQRQVNRRGQQRADNNEEQKEQDADQLDQDDDDGEAFEDEVDDEEGDVVLGSSADITDLLDVVLAGPITLGRVQDNFTLFAAHQGYGTASCSFKGPAVGTQMSLRRCCAIPQSPLIPIRLDIERGSCYHTTLPRLMQTIGYRGASAPHLALKRSFRKYLSGINGHAAFSEDLRKIDASQRPFFHLYQQKAEQHGAIRIELILGCNLSEDPDVTTVATAALNASSVYEEELTKEELFLINATASTAVANLSLLTQSYRQGDFVLIDEQLVSGMHQVFTGAVLDNFDCVFKHRRRHVTEQYVIRNNDRGCIRQPDYAQRLGLYILSQRLSNAINGSHVFDSPLHRRLRIVHPDTGEKLESVCIPRSLFNESPDEPNIHLTGKTPIHNDGGKLNICMIMKKYCLITQALNNWLNCLKK